MAVATETRRYTPEDLLKITDRPMPELIDGELVERETSQELDAIAVAIAFEVGNFVRQHDLGLMNGAQGSYQIFPDQPRKVRIPDASFTRKERLPDGPSKGHAVVAPDLAVEVISPNDTADDVQLKVTDFLGAGVRLVWVFYPESRTVQVYRGDGGGQLLRGDDVLDGGDVLPGFRCPVGRFFA